MVFARDHLSSDEQDDSPKESYDSIITGKTFLLIVSSLECKDSIRRSIEYMPKTYWA